MPEHSNQPTSAGLPTNHSGPHREPSRGPSVRSRSFRTAALACLAATTAVLGLRLHAAETTPLEDLRNLWKEWSRVKAIVSEERNAWAREQQSIADAIAVSRQEVELLATRLSELSNSSSGTEKQRSDLLEKIADSKASLAVFAAVVDKYEARVRELLPVIPDHLRAELAPLLQRLPAEGKATQLSVSQRMQTVIAFLAQLDKFNAGPSMVSEIREVEPGRSLEVRTLYFGLGAAYYTDAAATFAGIGQPTLEGWKWTRVDAPVGKSIAEAIAVYQNEKQPAFVTLPARVR